MGPSELRATGIVAVSCYRQRQQRTTSGTAKNISKRIDRDVLGQSPRQYWPLKKELIGPEYTYNTRLWYSSQRVHVAIWYILGP